MTPNPLFHSLAVVAAAALTACQSPTAGAPTPSSAAVRPVSTTLPAAPATDDTAAIIDRFTSAIWPAVVDYHFHPAQNGPAQLRWLTIIEPGLDQTAWGALRQGTQDLGELVPDDDPTRNSAGIEGIQLASTSVSAATDADTEATVTACYTFTALSYTMQSGFEPERTPAAAAAEFTVTYSDSWRLTAITNQHAVPGC